MRCLQSRIEAGAPSRDCGDRTHAGGAAGGRAPDAPRGEREGGSYEWTRGGSSAQEHRDPTVMQCISLLVLMPTLVSALSSSQTITRRGAVSAAAAIFGSRALSSRAATPATIIATGIVKNDPNCMGLTCSGLTPVPSNGALYISLRPSKNDAAVRPMATARFAGPITFPYEWAFSAADLTPEYSGMDATALASYLRADLTISVRFDDDGVLSTNGPDDLVGRSMLRKRGASEPGMWEPAVVQLQGRGYAGRISASGK